MDYIFLNDFFAISDRENITNSLLERFFRSLKEKKKEYQNLNIVDILKLLENNSYYNYMENIKKEINCNNND